MDVASPLESWANFYIIVGSSAGALTGLQFVVMTLTAERMPASSGESVSAFGTPNVVHFCAALLVGSILCIPWDVLRPAGIAVAVVGGLGVLYSAIVLRRAIRQRVYQPVFEDWLWHTCLPAVAYATMLVAGVFLGRNRADSLFFIGPAALLLVFIGIHNAWDTVTYITMRPVLGKEGGVSAGRAGAASTEATRGSAPAGTSGPTPPAQG
jgi:hypothetical protein